MTWNYRIIQFDDCEALHEVYYDDEGRPTAYTENAVDFVFDHPGDIEDGLRMALRDVQNYPKLPRAVFDLPIDQRPITPRSEKHG